MDQKTEAAVGESVEGDPTMNITEAKFESEKGFEQAIIEETEELLDKTLGEFRHLIKDDGEKDVQARILNIEVARSDKYLLMFLRARKFEVPRAFKILGKYEAFKKKYGYANIEHKDVAKVLNLGVFAAPAEVRDKEGHRVVFVFGCKYDLTDVSEDEMAMAFWWIMTKVVEEDEETQKRGVTVAIDCKDMVFWGQFRKLIAIEERLGKMFQDCFPLRVGHMIMANENTFFWAIWSIVKLFLKTKLRSRCHVVGQHVENLTRIIAVENLPPELGGSLALSLEKDFYQDFEQN